MSVNPRTAFVGVPDGLRPCSGTPKKARKYNEAESSSRSRSTSLACHAIRLLMVLPGYTSGYEDSDLGA